MPAQTERDAPAALGSNEPEPFDPGPEFVPADLRDRPSPPSDSGPVSTDDQDGVRRRFEPAAPSPFDPDSAPAEPADVGTETAEPGEFVPPKPEPDPVRSLEAAAAGIGELVASTASAGARAGAAAGRAGMRGTLAAARAIAWAALAAWAVAAATARGARSAGAGAGRAAAAAGRGLAGGGRSLARGLSGAGHASLSGLSAAGRGLRGGLAAVRRLLAGGAGAGRGAARLIGGVARAGGGLAGAGARHGDAARRALAERRRRGHARRGRKRAERARRRAARSAERSSRRRARPTRRERERVSTPTEKAGSRPAVGPRDEARGRPRRGRTLPAKRRLPRPRLGPSAKLGLGLAGVTAAGALTGFSLGLPTPFERPAPPPGPTASQARAQLLAGVAATAEAPVSEGTSMAATKGPFHPVIGPVSYGEEGAQFGASRGGRSHEGHDVFSEAGTPLVAVRDGVVVDGGRGSGMQSGAGHHVSVYSRLDDRTYVYLHLLKPASVKLGDEVRAGQVIGRMGCTGSCFGVHLHFEVRKGVHSFFEPKKAVDPLPLLKSWPQAKRP